MLERLNQLLKAVGSTNSVLILPHNDPDPDAIASALALQRILEDRRGIEGTIAYEGIIGRAENKALVRYLGHPLRHLADSDLYQSVPIALVDTQPHAGNNPLPPERTAAIVIDHHNLRDEAVTATFADVRPDTGATSTILLEYLLAAGIEPPAPLATALFYGIKTDTMGLGRNASQADVDAYFFLQSRIDVEALGEIGRAQVPAAYFKRLAATLHAAQIYDNVVVSYVGRMRRPDLAAEMADLLLRLRGAHWVICMGAYKGTLVLSVRTRNQQGGAGQLVQEIVGEQGTAGGHGVMSGGQVPLNSENPEQTAVRLSRQALEQLQVPPETTGKPLLS